MKTAFAFLAAMAAASSATAFTPETIPGALAPVGFFDPLGFAAKANEATLKRYREAELTHGRVAMLAAVGFLVGEAVEGKSVLWDASITGPAINHLPQVPPILWVFIGAGIAKAESIRAEIGWVEPENVPVDKPGQLREEYIPGNLGFDPLGLYPQDEAGQMRMQTTEIKNGRLAMIAISAFAFQEFASKLGVVNETPIFFKPIGGVMTEYANSGYIVH